MTYVYKILGPFLALADAIKAHVAIICGLTILLMAGDAYSFLTNPDDYIPVHHLDPSQPYWQWQYLKGSAIIFVVCATCLTTIILSYRDWYSRAFQLISQLFILFIIIRLIVGFYQGYQCGFDHDC
jgi:hypothetical protein